MNRAVASNTDSPLEEVASRFWHKVSVDIVRGSYRAFKRRMLKTQGGADGAWAANPYRQLGGLLLAEGM